MTQIDCCIQKIKYECKFPTSSDGKGICGHYKERTSFGCGCKFFNYGICHSEMARRFSQKVLKEKSIEFKQHDVDIFLEVWSNGTDKIVAYSPEDARDAYAEATGETMDDLDGWFELPTEKMDREDVLTIIDEDSGTVTRTIHEWIELNGRGVLCSTEF